MLFKTRNSSRDWHTSAFIEDYVYLSSKAALYLVECGIKAVGIDYLSVDAYEKGKADTHRILLEHGIWIIEGLDLSHVNPGIYEMICLPLRIAHGDGAPARAIVKPVKKSMNRGDGELSMRHLIRGDMRLRIKERSFFKLVCFVI